MKGENSADIFPKGLDQILLDRDFEIEREEMTPTLKVRRSIVEEKYKAQIDELYRE
jgi:long-chain acyl-CoA synthetase